MLLDCGEGTWAGLVQARGHAPAAKMLASLTAVWVSHQHADHCLGLVELLGFLIEGVCCFWVFSLIEYPLPKMARATLDVGRTPSASGDRTTTRVSVAA